MKHMTLEEVEILIKSIKKSINKIKDILIDAQEDIRDLRDSDNHLCPNHENDEDECTCAGYDAVIDKLETAIDII